MNISSKKSKKKLGEETEDIMFINAEDELLYQVSYKSVSWGIQWHRCRDWGVVGGGLNSKLTAYLILESFNHFKWKNETVQL